MWSLGWLGGKCLYHLLGPINFLLGGGKKAPKLIVLTATNISWNFKYVTVYYFKNGTLTKKKKKKNGTLCDM